MNPDGTSRIIAFWDPYDDTWDKSKHTVGSAPPINWEDSGKPAGTVYTNDQINDALKGKIQIQRTDRIGHGTACTEPPPVTAWASRQRPTSSWSMPIRRIRMPLNFPAPSRPTGSARWQRRGEPCVISLSFGGHLAGHDGSAPGRRRAQRSRRRWKQAQRRDLRFGRQRGPGCHARTWTLRTRTRRRGL